LAESMPNCDLPPDVPMQWLNDAGLNPDGTVIEGAPAEPVPPGAESPGTMRLVPPDEAKRVPPPQATITQVQRIPPVQLVNHPAPIPPGHPR